MTEKKKLRVLISDDEAHIRMMLKMTLSSMGAEIVGEAKNGGEAVELFKKTQPNIMLLDVNMPIKTGDQVLKEINPQSSEVCVIMMTSVADIETIETCINLGASGYILKDTPLNEMKTMIKEAWANFKK